MIKILIVDDASFMRMTLANILNKNGFEVVGEAENGVAALKKYIETKPDLVSMDITMPEMDGIQALKLIRQYDPSAKVVMISSMGQEDRIKEAVMSGAKSFIVKPFKEDIVVKTLSKIAAM